MHPVRQRLLIGIASIVASLALTGWIFIGVTRRVPPSSLGPPSADVFRIYVLGGSTAAGAPYTPRCDIGRLVTYLFAGTLGERRIQVINLAASGEDTARVLERAREVAQVSHPRDSAIAILYSGDNEFMKFIDPRQANQGGRHLFDTPLLPPEKREEVFRHYAVLVEEIAHTLERSGVPLVVCTGAMNIADREPNRSVLDDANHEAPVHDRLDAAEAAFAKDDLPTALLELDRALAIEPHFAWTHKRRGDVLRQLGRFDEAHAALQAAVDYDQAPISFTSMQNEALRAWAQKLGLDLVDCEAILRAASKDGLPGYDLFWDTCHPTMGGFLDVATGVAEAMEKRYHVQRRRLNPTVAAIESAFLIDREFKTDMLIGRGQSMYGLSLLTWHPKERLKRAQIYLDEAAKDAPDSPALACSRAVLYLIDGDLERSCAQWRAALVLDAAMARMRVKHPSVVWLLHTRGIEDPQAVFGP